MFKKASLHKYFAITSIFILVGFFSCVLHIGPQNDHEIDSSSHESKNSKVACVDHQISTPSSKDLHVDLMVAILPNNAHEILASIQPSLVQNETVSIEKPPDKIALYIKNSVFRL